MFDLDKFSNSETQMGSVWFTETTNVRAWRVSWLCSTREGFRIKRDQKKGRQVWEDDLTLTWPVDIF